jgi:hypothetical protein
MKSKQEDIEMFEERLATLCDDFIDNERLSESAILTVLRERVKYYAPFRRKPTTQRQVISKVLTMTDDELKALPDDKRQKVLELRDAITKKEAVK